METIPKPYKTIKMISIPRLLILLLFISASITLQAQQLPLYSQYMMNSFLLNPAVAGNDGLTSFNLTAREQWLGFENSPRTVAVSGQTRMLRNSPISRGRSVRNRPTAMSRSGNVGLGGYVFNDRNGLIDRTGFQGTYSYHIWMDENQLSFGVSATMFQLRLDERNILLHNGNDPLLNGSKNALFVPDINLGIYFSNPSYYFGASTAQLLQSALKFGNDGYRDFKMLRHFYFMTGYGFFLDNGFTVEPSVMVQATMESQIQADINTRIYYRDDYWGGISYRTSGALIMMGGVKVDRFYFGYAFDYAMNNIRKHSFGSHEFMVSVKFGDTARRYRWLNRY
jgi:type IX secretion system PorP/SprF family membrane protein